MKKFTKGALIAALVFVALGTALCFAGAGIGFHYSSIPKMIKEGVFSIGPEDVWHWNDWDNDWKSWNGGTTEEYDFSAEECSEIRSLNLVVDCGIVEVEETGKNEGIHIDVKYRRKNSKRNISVDKSGDTLKIKDDTSWNFLNSDNIYIKIQIPADMEFETVELQNKAGEVSVNHALHTKDLNVIVGAGECNINKELQVAGTLYAEVDAGQIDFAGISAEKLELNAGVGELDVEHASADEVILDCGVGELNITLDGREDDYSYSVDCGVGEVTVGGSDYSGLGATKEVTGGDKKVNIDCGVGEITVDFTK